MLFNSFAFILFFAVVLLLYRVSPSKYKKWLLLIASYAFYALWDWRFLPLILFSTLLDFQVGKLLALEEGGKRRKFLLGISLVGNLSPLLFFKYYTFLVENATSLLHGLFGWTLPLPHWNILLPVGISFYTFQTLSYSIDLYKRKTNTAKSLLDFALFVVFFPQLVAGPIEKSRDLLPQLQNLPKWQPKQLRYGLLLFSYGLTSKVLIADSAGWWVEQVFSKDVPANGVEALLAALLFSIQIYMDFAGYTLMALGLARCFGIRLSDNFHQPYLSSNITDFWRRWHITLSSWLKEYIYIPLGGNRKGQYRQYVNLMATMLIGGLWHGANWTFIIWGAIHGGMLMVHKLISPTVSRLPAWGAWLGVPITFITVTFAWIFFRASDATQAYNFIYSILFEWPEQLAHPMWQPLVWCGGMTLVLDLLQRYYSSPLFLRKWPLPVQYAILLSCWGTVALILMPHKPQPFIYFQF